MTLEILKKTLVENKKVVLTIRLRPNASQNKITGFMSDGSLKISLSAPATDNKANQELIKLLAGEFGVSAKNVTIISGATTRIKLVRVLI